MKKIWIVLLSLSVMLSGCAGYAPGQQSYWDAQVKEMCERDGGVTFRGKVVVSKAEITALGKVGGFISIPPQALAKPTDPVFSVYQETAIRESNPRVTRWEETIYRRSDGAEIATTVRYRRAGGDFPAPAEPSSFSCPEEKEIFRQREAIFELK